jgi:hypothetical protein
MSDKKEIEEPGLSTEAAKVRELDERPKPTMKVSHPPTPSSKKNQAHMTRYKDEELLNNRSRPR